MSFATVQFMVFFAVVLVLLGLSVLPRVERLLNRIPICERTGARVARQWFLLIASYVFYGWWDWRFCFLMAALTLCVYVAALRIEVDASRRRVWTAFGVVVPLLALAAFKYCDFFVGSFCAVAGLESPGTLGIILPVGISFYTFQSLSYVIDVSKGKFPAEHSLRKVALYVAFFPQLVAGPIVKACDFLPQLDEDRKPSWRLFQQGAWIFLFGLAKKIVLADNLAVLVDQVFVTPAAFDTFTVWLAIMSYALQIYLDFSGYSDMAVGAAKCMGYDLPRNFNLPYLSKNLTEFWKRWHISLSSWLQEYLYFALGGSRKGNRYVNIMIVMLLGGLWHGAAWTFVAWGAVHGVGLCVHKVWQKHRPRRSFGVFGTALSTALTCLFVSLCWVIFRADSFSLALQVFQGAFTLHGGIFQPYVWSFIALALVLAAYIAATVSSRHQGINSLEGFYFDAPLDRFWPLVLFFVVMGLIVCLAHTGASPFIYFQF